MCLIVSFVLVAALTSFSDFSFCGSSACCLVSGFSASILFSGGLDGYKGFVTTSVMAGLFIGSSGCFLLDDVTGISDVFMSSVKAVSISFSISSPIGDSDLGFSTGLGFRRGESISECISGAGAKLS